MEQDEFTREQKREEARKRFEEEKKKAADEREKKKQEGRSMKYAVFGIVAGMIVIAAFFLISGHGPADNNTSSLMQNVQWEATADVYVCGEKQSIQFSTIAINEKIDVMKPPTLAEYSNKSSFNISYESLVWKFGNKTFEKINGDLCNGTAGKWKMFVDEQESNEWGGHRIYDGEKYLFEFG